MKIKILMLKKDNEREDKMMFLSLEQLQKLKSFAGTGEFVLKAGKENSEKGK